MAKKLHAIRMDEDIIHKLQVLAATYRLSQGDLLAKLMDGEILNETETTEELTNSQKIHYHLKAALALYESSADG